MKVNVYFYGVLKKFAGYSHIEVEVEENTSIKKLVRAVIKKINKADFAERFYDRNRDFVKPDIVVLINDKDINLLEGEKTIIKEGNKIVFIPSIHGG
ncbi:MAG: hypothetical protein DRN04_09550 [Thermoprotei archaeon]|nr:MAG: hypothetical protein DRN04_09550 [Thermoprotei archaeon]